MVRRLPQYWEVHFGIIKHIPCLKIPESLWEVDWKCWRRSNVSYKFLVQVNFFSAYVKYYYSKRVSILPQCWEVHFGIIKPIPYLKIPENLWEMVWKCVFLARNGRVKKLFKFLISECQTCLLLLLHNLDTACEISHQLEQFWLS